jgi:SAM-dependent methyltransferase
MEIVNKLTQPGAGQKTEKMPGHWVLARMGKRVLRPGGLGLTRWMLGALEIHSSDSVVEFAPGLGLTAKLTLALGPASYTAVERDEGAATAVRSYLSGGRERCVVGSAAETGLPVESATVIYGEAMLTMQNSEMKRRIVREAARLLKPGGRYAIHEMCLADRVSREVRGEVERALSGVVHHGVRPLTVSEWRSLLTSEGFEVRTEKTAPMSLLEPGRIIRDEGLLGAIRFAVNMLRDGEGRKRVLRMRSVFHRHRAEIHAVSIIAERRKTAG